VIIAIVIFIDYADEGYAAFIAISLPASWPAVFWLPHITLLMLSSFHAINITIAISFIDYCIIINSH